MAAMYPPTHTAANTMAPYTSVSPATSPDDHTTSSTATVDDRLLTLKSSPIITTSRGSHPTPARDTIPLLPSSPPTATTITVITVQTRKFTIISTRGAHMPTSSPRMSLTNLRGGTHQRAFSTLPLRSPSSLLLVSQPMPVVAPSSLLKVVNFTQFKTLFSSCSTLTIQPSSDWTSKVVMRVIVVSYRLMSDSNSRSMSLVFSQIPWLTMTATSFTAQLMTMVSVRSTTLSKSSESTVELTHIRTSPEAPSISVSHHPKVWSKLSSSNLISSRTLMISLEGQLPSMPSTKTTVGLNKWSL